jgi:hypothetical protein
MKKTTRRATARLAPERVSHRLPNSGILGEIGAIPLLHTQLDNQLRMLVMDLAKVTKDEALDATERQGSEELRQLVNKLGKRQLGECGARVKLSALVNRCGHAADKKSEWMHAV